MILSNILEGGRIKLVDVNGDSFEGFVSDYIYPYDNEPEGIARICLENCLNDLDSG